MLTRALVLAALAAALASPQAPEIPMPVPAANTARYRWLSKPVQESRLLDGMEALDRWSQSATFGYGTPVEPRAELVLATERVKDGRYSLRLRSQTIGD